MTIEKLLEKALNLSDKIIEPQFEYKFDINLPQEKKKLYSLSSLHYLNDAIHDLMTFEDVTLGVEILLRSIVESFTIGTLILLDDDFIKRLEFDSLNNEIERINYVLKNTERYKSDIDFYSNFTKDSLQEHLDSLDRRYKNLQRKRIGGTGPMKDLFTKVAEMNSFNNYNYWYAEFFQLLSNTATHTSIDALEGKYYISSQEKAATLFRQRITYWSMEIIHDRILLFLVDYLDNLSKTFNLGKEPEIHLLRKAHHKLLAQS